ncbi:hypothetical protein K491DRAFT_397057 [Lophiostoma macrostomum CBS 122681]|uniref:Uncharacterized protein n=1 Tax=Lophiostoma macrostomum CBS 122681 TaxID=1314788 RepID=A0A6A6TA67_9PLEO|nr:hypothetical protein K491DRAFT_397057 [Lophiostoma macrostomum CBS 122681]
MSSFSSKINLNIPKSQKPPSTHPQRKPPRTQHPTSQEALTPLCSGTPRIHHPHPDTRQDNSLQLALMLGEKRSQRLQLQLPRHSKHMPPSPPFPNLNTHTIPTPPPRSTQRACLKMLNTRMLRRIIPRGPPSKPQNARIAKTDFTLLLLTSHYCPTTLRPNTLCTKRCWISSLELGHTIPSPFLSS